MLSLKNTKKRDFWIILAIASYCLAYALLRFNVSEVMDWDESEQFLNASVLKLGNERQAPLYSWIIYGLDSFLDAKMQIIFALRYILMFIFFFGFYQVSRSFFEAKYAVIALASLMLLPIYSYSINYKLTHTVLLIALSSIGLWIYTKLLANRSFLNYALLGVCFGLGIISKYNYLFLILCLVLASLGTKLGKETLLNKKVLVAITCTVIVIFPHIQWLINEGFPSVSHALGRGDSGQLNVFNIPNLIRAFFHYMLQANIMSVVFIACFFPFINLKANSKSQPIRTFRLFTLYSLILPLLVIIFLKLDSFPIGWLAPTYFAVPITLLTFIDLNKVSKVRYQIFLAICLVTTLSLFLTKSVLNFSPDTAGKARQVHFPYSKLNNDIQKIIRLEEAKKVTITSNNIAITMNLKNIEPSFEVRTFEDMKNSYQEADGLNLYLWNASQFGKRVPKQARKAFPNFERITILRRPYLRSSKLKPFMLGVAKI